MKKWRLRKIKWPRSLDLNSSQTREFRTTGITPTFFTLPENFLCNRGQERFQELPWWLRWWRICLQCRRPECNPWIGKIPWRRKWLLTPVFLPGKSHGQKFNSGDISGNCTYISTFWFWKIKIRILTPLSLVISSYLWNGLHLGKDICSYDVPTCHEARASNFTEIYLIYSVFSFCRSQALLIYLIID